MKRKKGEPGSRRLGTTPIKEPLPIPAPESIAPVVIPKKTAEQIDEETENSPPPPPP